MSRLYLFAEGQEKQTFARTGSQPHLANFGVYLDKILLIAHCKKKGVVHRGGGRKYQPMKNDIVTFLLQEKKADVFFTTMIDLYAIHADFPGLADAQKLGTSLIDELSSGGMLRPGHRGSEICPVHSSCTRSRPTCFLIPHAFGISTIITIIRLLHSRKSQIDMPLPN